MTDAGHTIPMPVAAVGESENTQSYANACGELIESLCLQAHVSDDALHALVDAQPTPEQQKQLTMGLFCAGLIDRDQCAAAFLWFPIREA